jgi:aryl-alcohol dehydrogenase-like predicted oxidoreductase
MRIDQAATEAVIDAAIEHGVTFFDTADVYGGRGKSEEMMGVALKGKRHQIVLATKFAMQMGGPDKQGGSRRYIMEAVEASLKRLQTDYIDLYQMHRPDPDTPIEETLSALDDLVTQGKVRYVGNSNYAGWQIADAEWTARTEHLNRFVSAQNNYSLLERNVEHEVSPACARFGLGLLPFFPLASGLLTGKYKRGEAPPEGTRLAAWGPRGAAALNDKNFDRLEALSSWAEERGHDLLDLAFAWLLGHPAVSSVIAGATKPEQVAANAATAAWKLTPAEVEEVTKLAA